MSKRLVLLAIVSGSGSFRHLVIIVMAVDSIVLTIVFPCLGVLLSSLTSLHVAHQALGIKQDESRGGYTALMYTSLCMYVKSMIWGLYAQVIQNYYMGVSSFVGALLGLVGFMAVYDGIVVPRQQRAALWMIGGQSTILILSMVKPSAL